MKYLTKDWYNRMQKTNYHLLLVIDESANEYSEELYNEIYKKEKNKYLDMMKHFLDYEVYKKDILHLYSILNEKKTEDEIKSDFEKQKNERLHGCTIEEIFDNQIESKIFELKEELPKNILNEVKDIRLLALNYATSDIYNKIKKYSEENEKFVQNQLREYQKSVDNQFKNSKLDYLNESFHDCQIIKYEFVENNLKISINNQGGFTNKENIIFENCNIIKENNHIIDSYWLYDEIYKVDNKYEVHVLLDTYNGLNDLIFSCDNIIVK